MACNKHSGVPDKGKVKIFRPAIRSTTVPISLSHNQSHQTIVLRLLHSSLCFNPQHTLRVYWPASVMERFSKSIMVLVAVVCFVQGASAWGKHFTNSTHYTHTNISANTTSLSSSFHSTVNPSPPTPRDAWTRKFSYGAGHHFQPFWRNSSGTIHPTGPTGTHHPTSPRYKTNTTTPRTSNATIWTGQKLTLNTHSSFLSTQDTISSVHTSRSTIRSTIRIIRTISLYRVPTSMTTVTPTSFITVAFTPPLPAGHVNSAV